MRKLFLIACLLLGAALPAAGQGGFTTVTGTITGPIDGLVWSCGTISAQLITAGGAAPTLNGGGFSTSTSPIGLGCPSNGQPAGSFVMRLADSGVIVPSNTTWQFTVTMSPGIAPPAGTGPQSFTYTTAINCSTNTPSTCTANSMSISAQLSALAPKLSNAGTGGSSFPVTTAVAVNSGGSITVNTGGSIGAAGTGTITATDINPVSSIPASCTPGTSKPLRLTVAPFYIYTCKANGLYSADSPITNAVYASDYGVQFDSHFTNIPSLTNTSNIVTAADANFTGLDYLGRPIAKVGQQFYCTNATNDTSQATSVGILGQTTIQSIDSATQVHTVANATATTTASGACGWGDPDTALGAQTQSTANDPMFAAWTAASTNCLPLIWPSGVGWFEQPEFNTFPATGGCGGQNSLTVTRRGFSVSGGASPNGSMAIISPNLAPANCNGPNASSIGCYFSAPNMILQNIQLWGLGNSAPGAGFNGKSLVFISGSSPGVNFSINRSYFFGFGANQGSMLGSHLIGINIGNGVGLAVSGGTISDSIAEAFGAETTHIDPAGGGGTVNVGLSNYWSVVGRLTLYAHSGVVSDANGLYGFTFGTTDNAGDGMGVSIDNGAIFDGTNTAIPYASTSSAGAANLSCGGSAGGGTRCNLTNAEIINAAAGNSAIFLGGGGTLSLINTFVSAPFAIFTNGLGATSCATSACSLFDAGNNSITGTTTTFTGATGLTVTGWGATKGGNPYGTTTNCSSSAAPAVCGAAISGSVTIAAAATTVTVNTTAVTANSQISLSTDDTLGTKLGVTCNSTLATLIGGLTVSARTAGTSFQITSGATPAVNPLCISFTITN